MTLLVPDASFAAAFAIPSQSTAAAARLAADWSRYQPIAPYVYDLEVPWLLLRHERRVRQPGYARRLLAQLASLAVVAQPAADPSALADAYDLAERHDISLFDALYLMLAIEANTVLATKDGGLVRAAGVFGVEVLDVR